MAGWIPDAWTVRVYRSATANLEDGGAPMTTPSKRSTRRPRDDHARNRLQRAQQLESEALADVYVARENVTKACSRRDAAIAVATARVEHAQRAAESAEEALVRVSGLDRAALLLGVETTTLRKVRTTKTSGG